MSFSIESYGGGYIVAEYDENIPPFGCRYYDAFGTRVPPRTQPMGLTPFESRLGAEDLVKELEAR